MFNISFSDGYTPDTTLNKTELSMYVIIGIVVVIIVIFATAAAYYFCYWKRTKQDKPIRDSCSNKANARQNHDECIPLNSHTYLPSSGKKVHDSLLNERNLDKTPRRFRPTSTSSNSSQGSYDYKELTDAQKRKVLEDPLATEECKKKIKEDLAARGSADPSTKRNKQAIVDVGSRGNKPTNSGNHFLASGGKTHDSLLNERNLDKTPRRFRPTSTSSNSSQGSYDYKELTDAQKQKVLEDPLATEECKKKIREDLAARGSADPSTKRNKQAIVDVGSRGSKPTNSGNHFLASGGKTHDSRSARSPPFELPLRPRARSTSSSSSCGSYVERTMSDEQKLKVLNDPLASEDCKEQIRYEMKRKGKLP